MKGESFITYSDFFNKTCITITTRDYYICYNYDNSLKLSKK